MESTEEFGKFLFGFGLDMSKMQLESVRSSETLNEKEPENEMD